MRKEVDMISAPLLPNIIRFTVPVILTSVLQLLFNAADLVVVGQFCGSLSVGAVGATASLTNLLLNLFVGLSVGAGVITAQGLGAGDSRSVHETVHAAIPLALLCGAILTVAGIAVAEPVLAAMSTPENVLPLSATYMRVIFAGVTFNIVYNFGAAILRAAGDTRGPLRYLTFAGVINVILNVIFVTVWDMNVAGVALATIISQAISAVLVVNALMLRTDACCLVLREMRLRKEPLLAMLRVGLPAGIQSSLFSISNVVIQSSINSFGDVFISANSASVSIEGFILTIALAFQQAAVNFVGQNAGARRYDRVRQTVRICNVWSIVLTAAACVLAYAFGPQLLWFYLADSPEAIADGMVRMLCVGLPFFTCCHMDTYTGALRGLGRSVTPMVTAVLGICGFRILWVYTVFRYLHTPQCLYVSFPLSWIITGIVQGVALFRILRQLEQGQAGAVSP